MRKTAESTTRTMTKLKKMLWSLLETLRWRLHYCLELLARKWFEG